MNRWHTLAQGFYVGEYQFLKRQPAATSRSCLIDLGNGQFVVYSPGSSLLEHSKKIIGEGEVFLITPNFVHNLGIADWVQQFPQAHCIAASGAKMRLLAKTGVEFEDLDVWQAKLPTQVGIHALPGNGVGECWLNIDRGESVYWCMGDAFFNFATLPKRGLLKWVMKLNRMGPGLEISRVYQALGYRDKRAFSRWCHEVFDRDKRNIFIPCHGQILDEDHGVDKLLKLIGRRLGR